MSGDQMTKMLRFCAEGEAESLKGCGSIWVKVAVKLMFGKIQMVAVWRQSSGSDSCWRQLK